MNNPHQTQPLTKEQVYQRLYQQDKTLKQWAEEKGYTYQTAIRVMNGSSKAMRGESLAIAIDLGLKTIA